MKKMIRFSALLVMSIAVVTVAAMPVSRIQIEGGKWVNADVVRSALPFAVGAEITKADITQAIKAVYQTGFYEKVSIDYHEGTVSIAVVAKPVVSNVSREGDDSVLKQEQLDRMYKEADFVVGKPLNMSAVQRVENLMLQFYRFQGYYGATVSSNIENEKHGRVDVVFKTDLGKEAIVESINITGNKAYHEATLLKQMQLKPSGLLSFITSDDRYSRVKLDMDLASLENWYYDAGYMDFAIRKDQVKLTNDNTQVDIDIQIAEGARYRIGKIDVESEADIDQGALRDLLVIHDGDWYSRQALRDSVNQLNRYLSEHGHTGAVVTAKMLHVDTTSHEVHIAIIVHAGIAYTVRDIEFTGNYITDEKVLRHALTQYEGTIYNQAEIDTSTRKLKNLGYLKNANCLPKPIHNTHFVDVNCHVEEAMASSMTGRIGYSDTEKFLYGLNFSQNNFLGTGNRFSIDFNRSEAEKSFNISHGWPNLTVDGVSGDVSIFYKETTPNRVNVSQYHTDNYGVSLGFGIPVAKDHRLSTSVGYEHIIIKTFDKSPTEITDYTQEYGDTFQQVKWNLSWGYNSLDRFIFPNSGQTHDFVADIAIPYNDENKTLSYYKLIYKNTVYQPLFRIGKLGDVTLLSRTSIGYGGGLGNQDDELPWFKNFFAGGIGSVRGYEANSLGPKGTLPSGATGKAIGGNILLTHSINFIIPQNINEDMRFSVFADMGNIYDGHYALSDLRYAVGVSLQWRTAVAPLVFNLGFPIHLRAEDNKDVFSFSISTGA